MATSRFEDFNPPKERYLRQPEDQSCYEYMLECYDRISKDIGDYDAFVVPVADQYSETKMSKMIADVEKFASYLTSIGIKKGDVFTVFLPTSAHAFIALYALTKLGVIANYVHPLTPPQAFVEVLQLTKSKGIMMLDIAAGPFAPLLEKLPVPVVVCSTSDYCDGIAYQYALHNEMQNAKVPDLPNVTRYKDIMAMDLPPVPTVKGEGKKTSFYLHGGGTTGKSKTVILTSYAFNSLAYKYYVLDQPHDYKTAHCICALPCFHAYGLAGSMHYGLCNAYKPILFPKFDPHQANEMIRKLNVTEILGVPKMFQKMMDSDNFENEGLKNLAMCFAGGDIVSDACIERFNNAMIKHGAKARLGRGYGLTEMCGCASTNCYDHHRSQSVGYPLPGLTVEIWDDDAKELPVGEVGEIVLSGDLIMQGYLADGIVPDNGIYTDENGTQWIRTGDMGYLDEDGFIYFSGRKKRIIIIAGYNIYPSTIEEIVDKLDYISEVCAVQGYDDETGKPLVKLVVSFADSVTDKEKALEDLKAYCAANIEGYGCPRKYVVMDLLPRTKMEKIDFMKLNDPVPAATV
ncbi:MAG: class I adenylate-forming enzyme family protein [Acutalibacteraceae bacterium]